MSKYLGDVAANSIVTFTWSTNDGSGGSITRSTDGTIQVYKDSSATQTVEGVTDTEDFDSLTGVHHCAVNTAINTTFYATGSDFHVVLNGSVIDTQTVNASLAQFSVENRYTRGTDSAYTGTPPSAATIATTTNTTLSTAHGAGSWLSGSSTGLNTTQTEAAVTSALNTAVPSSPTANSTFDHLVVIDAQVGGVTNTDTANQVGFNDRSGSEVARNTYGTGDGERTARTLP